MGETKGKALKNQSMLEDERLENNERILKRFNTTWGERCGAPAGHVYSVMVEELEIQKPDLKGFIDDVNEYMQRGGDYFARIKSPFDEFYSRTISYLDWYLENKVLKDEINQKSRDLIVKEARGGIIRY